MLGVINYILLVATISLIIWLNVTSSINKKKSVTKMSDIIDAESRSNFARRKDLPDAFYFIPDISELPAQDYGDVKNKLSTKQARVLKLAGSKLIRLPEAMSNREIKMAYGPSNLETVTNGEERYQAFLSSLMDWADALLEINDSSSAEIVLKKAIEYGCDISRCFVNLATIYINNHDKTSLDKLLATLENGEAIPKDEITRNKTIAKIKKMYDNM